MAAKHLLSIAELSDEQAAMVQQVHARFPDFNDGDVLGYLQYRNWDIAQAEAQMRTTQGFRKSHRPTIADVAPFILPAPGCFAPDACQILLEDMKGGVLKDNEGRLVILWIGLCHGTPAEQLAQQAYVCRRCRLYAEPGKVMRFCTVIEAKGRGAAVRLPAESGTRLSFRYPDKGSKALMDAQKQHFPATQYGANTHVCGVPRAVQWGFALMRPFMSKEAYEALMLRTDFAHLKNHLPASSLLKEWGGEVEFDLVKYVKWRAKEEGITIDPSLVRRFEPSDSNQIEDNSPDSFAGITSATVSKWDPAPVKMGAVEKQGSGQGWFATNKWKGKLLAAGPPGFACYFDSEKVSDSNTASRVIPLFGAFVQSDADGSKKHAWTLVTPQRTFKFAASDAAGADAWVAALRTCIHDATVLHAENQRKLLNGESPWAAAEGSLAQAVAQAQAEAENN
eukprot:CAMPEP_0180233496 /NCGR_PEP_ID=MMETSP0987-20121128/28106_1 /TAXON_ID=697907 /ORGANISM="non described non described, Strain CCMP2293" /LENGTH=450 /DNA_ID=CAMNT_0022199317 /DNA_START=33 /DNA_END=1385 /DNA_ORIENTATION=+